MNRLLTARCCFVKTLQREQHGPQVQVCLREIRLKPNRLRVVSRRLFQPPLFGKHTGQAAISLGVIRLAAENLFVASNRPIWESVNLELVANPPQVVQNVELIGVKLKGLLKTRSSLVELALLQAQHAEIVPS